MVSIIKGRKCSYAARSSSPIDFLGVFNNDCIIGVGEEEKWRRLQI
jgi:hypothetical protein